MRRMAVLDPLASYQVKAAVRDGILRIGFHAFNDEADIDAAIQIISDPKAQQGESRQIPTMNQRSTPLTWGHMLAVSASSGR